MSRTDSAITPNRFGQLWLAARRVVLARLLAEIGFALSDFSIGRLPRRVVIRSRPERAPPRSTPSAFSGTCGPFSRSTASSVTAPTLKKAISASIDGADLLKGGKSGRAAVVPGRSADSRLLLVVSGKDKKLSMPPDGAG